MPADDDIRRLDKKNPLALGADATRRMNRLADEPIDFGDSGVPKVAVRCPNVPVTAALVCGVGGNAVLYWEELSIGGGRALRPSERCLSRSRFDFDLGLDPRDVEGGECIGTLVGAWAADRGLGVICLPFFIAISPSMELLDMEPEEE